MNQYSLNTFWVLTKAQYVSKFTLLIVAWQAVHDILDFESTVQDSLAR